MKSLTSEILREKLENGFHKIVLPTDLFDDYVFHVQEERSRISSTAVIFGLCGKAWAEAMRADGKRVNRIYALFERSQSQPVSVESVIKKVIELDFGTVCSTSVADLAGLYDSQASPLRGNMIIHPTDQRKVNSAGSDDRNFGYLYSDTFSGGVLFLSDSILWSSDDVEFSEFPSKKRGAYPTNFGGGIVGGLRDDSRLMFFYRSSIAGSKKFEFHLKMLVSDVYIH